MFTGIRGANAFWEADGHSVRSPPNTNTENWIPFPKRLTAHLLRSRHLSTTGRAAPRISRTKARMGPDGGGRYVEAAGHARAMGPASAAAAAQGEGAGSWRDAPLILKKLHVHWYRGCLLVSGGAPD